MAQSTFTELVYDKVWTSDADFPTRQTNESQVRADMQYLFDVIKTFINGNDNVPGLLQEIVDYAATWQAGTIADESIETRHFAPSAKAPQAGKLNPGRKLIIANSDGTGGSSQNAPVFDGSADTTLLLPAAIKANLVGNVTGNLTGVAAYATALANARNFNLANSDGTGATDPVAFDGTGAITLRLPSTIKATLDGIAGSASKVVNKLSFGNKTFDGSAAVSLLLSDLAGAPLASPAFTGTPTAPTAAAGTNTTQIATTAFVKTAVPVATTTTPKMNGTAAVGSETKWAKGDHVHPTDTSRAAASHTHSASDITSGTFDLGRIPTITNAKLASGIAGSKITSPTTLGSFGARRIWIGSSTPTSPAKGDLWLVT